MVSDLQIGKLYTIKHPLLKEHRLYHFINPTQDYCGKHINWLQNNEMFIFLENIEVTFTFEQYRIRVLTSNGTTGWLALTNNGTRHISTVEG